MDPIHYWPLIAATAGVVFGAGQLVEKIKNNRYVSKTVCVEIHKAVDNRLGELTETVHEIRDDVKELMKRN